jgi:hypothetical protein
MPTSNTASFQAFLDVLARRFARQDILLVLDGAPNHRSGDLAVPDNITLLYLPPYSPELNPKENLWNEIREKIFKNMRSIYGGHARVDFEIFSGESAAPGRRSSGHPRRSQLAVHSGPQVRHDDAYMPHMQRIIWSGTAIGLRAPRSRELITPLRPSCQVRSRLLRQYKTPGSLTVPAGAEKRHSGVGGSAIIRSKTGAPRHHNCGGTLNVKSGGDPSRHLAPVRA